LCGLVSKGSTRAPGSTHDSQGWWKKERDREDGEKYGDGVRYGTRLGSVIVENGICIVFDM
jgi:hypothetical protein